MSVSQDAPLWNPHFSNDVIFCVLTPSPVQLFEQVFFSHSPAAHFGLVALLSALSLLTDDRKLLA